MPFLETITLGTRLALRQYISNQSPSRPPKKWKAVCILRLGLPKRLLSCEKKVLESTSLWNQVFTKHYGCKGMMHCGLIANGHNQVNQDFLLCKKYELLHHSLHSSHTQESQIAARKSPMWLCAIQCETANRARFVKCCFLLAEGRNKRKTYFSQGLGASVRGGQGHEVLGLQFFLLPLVPTPVKDYELLALL